MRRDQVIMQQFHGFDAPRNRFRTPQARQDVRTDHAPHARWQPQQLPFLPPVGSWYASNLSGWRIEGVLPTSSGCERREVPDK